MLINVTVLDADRWYLYRSSHFHHQLDRVVFSFELYEKASPEGITIVDRSPYDTIIYSQTLLEHGLLTSDDYLSVTRSFHALPPSYRADGHIIFLNLPVDRILSNIAERGREQSDIMFKEHFVKTLARNFRDFYKQATKVLPVIQLEGYTGETVLQLMEEENWIQSYDIKESHRREFDEYGI